MCSYVTHICSNLFFLMDNGETAGSISATSNSNGSRLVKCSGYLDVKITSVISTCPMNS